jgi:hypothetical protein
MCGEADEGSVWEAGVEVWGWVGIWSSSVLETVVGREANQASE